MTPVLLHVAPRGSTSSASVMTAPPAVSTRLRRSSAKKPRLRPSGEKNGPSASSVPAMGRASFASIERTQSMSGPSPLRAQKAIVLPSGDTARGRGLSVLDENRTPGGGRMAACTPPPPAAPRPPPCNARQAKKPAASRHAAAMIHGNGDGRRRAGWVWNVGVTIDTLAGPPSAAQRNCSFTSWAVWTRSSGSFASRAPTSRSSAGGLTGSTSPRGGGTSRMMALIRVAWLFPSKARRPVAIS